MHGILKNVEQSTAILARNGPALEKALADSRIAIQQTGNAAEQIGNLAASAQGTIDSNVDPAMANLRDTLQSANESMKTLAAAIAAARPGPNDRQRGLEGTRVAVRGSTGGGSVNKKK